MFKKNIVVAVDVDGVLRNFTKALGETYCTLNPEHEFVEETTDYALWKKHYPFKDKHEYDIFYQDMFPHLIFGAAEPTYRDIMNDLRQAMVTTVDSVRWIISTQQERKNWHYTFNWLMWHKCPINEFRFCANIEEKIAGVDMLIDDYDGNLQWASCHGVVPIRYEQPWNGDNYKAADIKQIDYSIKDFSELGEELKAWQIH